MKYPVIFGKQQGAVWAEFIIVALFVLVGVFTLVPLMGKMVDIKQKTEMGARYSAWERTVWFERVPQFIRDRNRRKSNIEIQNEIHSRVFATRDSGIHSQQKRDTRRIKYDPFNNFQNRSNRRYETLLKPKSRNRGDNYITLRHSEKNMPGLAGGVTDAITSIGALTTFDLNRKGYHNNTVEVELKEFEWFEEFAGINPTFKSNGAILADGWNAGGPRDAEHRVKGLLPQELLNNGFVDTVQDFVGWVPMFDELGSDSLELGKVDADVVPLQRIKRR